MERTVVVIKPDAMNRGLAGEIIRRLEARGLRIAGLKLMQFDRQLAERWYGEHKGKGFFEGLVSSIMASPVIAVVFEGMSAVESVRNTMGKTNPKDAAPGTIRGDFGLEIGRNLVHASDSVESGEREMVLLFREEELFSYTRAIDPWVSEYL